MLLCCCRGHQVSLKCYTEILLLLGGICGPYLAWWSPNSKREWNSVKMLNATNNHYNKLSLYFFHKGKNGNGHLCLSPFAGLAQVLSLGRSPRIVAGIVASAAGGQSGHTLGMSECQKQLRSRGLSLSGFSSPHSPFWLYSQPNFLESCKACPRRAAWCISFLGIQPTFTQVPPRPENKATVNILHVLA